MIIDTQFDFTTDTPGYWEGFWDKNDGLGGGGADPDSKSPTLKKYHQILWSKHLPNGEFMDLQPGNSYHYLLWKDFEFSSDSLVVEFRYYRNKHIIEQVKEKVGDYKKYYEDLIRKSYTIGGMTIFPMHSQSINQRRGCSTKISDRWDLTLECIRRYYKGQESPLYRTLEKDKAFFDLFVDFKGYVDYFFFQDAVSDDYSSVDIWCGKGDFSEDGLPKTVDEYFSFIEKELEFLDKRNKRIRDYCIENNL